MISNDFLGSAGKTARLTYKGGDGNDVAIVVDGDFPALADNDGATDSFTLRLDASGNNIQLLNGTARCRLRPGRRQHGDHERGG